MMTTNLVTGATGFLGRRLVRDLLDRGQGVTALVRAPDDIAARARLLSILGSGYDRSSLTAIAADLTCPIPIRGIAAAGPHDRMWHLAALLDLGRRRPAELKSVNVDGTAAALMLAGIFGIRRFHHVGTAFSCGNVRGPVAEDGLTPDPDPRNPYEESKHTAESLVRFEMARGLDVTIYRPSIVVGDARDGQAEIFGAFYQVLKLCYLARGLGDFVLPGRPETRLDLVPVDRVAAALTAIADRPDSIGRTYHLTNPAPPSLSDVVCAGRETLGLRITGILDVAPDALPWPSAAVCRPARAMMPYLRRVPEFARENTDRALGADFLRPVVPAAVWLRRLMSVARDRSFGQSQTSLRREQRLIERLAAADAPA